MVTYGQVIIGPPGGGKSTYCKVMQMVYNKIGRRTIVVNLDPQVTLNEMYYEPSINICDLIDCNKVTDLYQLGPNATLIYCMEYLSANFDWLSNKLNEFKDYYILYDTPGQVELLIHNNALKDILTKLQKNNQRLVCVNLMDSTLCVDVFKYISGLLSSLGGQIFLELPYVNVLSKIGLLRMMSKDMAYRLQYYTEACELAELIRILSEDKKLPDMKIYENFTMRLCELIEDYNMLSFSVMDIEDEDTIYNMIGIIDRTNGYISRYNDDNLYLRNIINDIEERLID